MTSASTRLETVRETKASRATDYGRSLAYRQNTLDLSIRPLFPPPVKRTAKERLNSRHVHKCTERRIIELSLTRLVGPRRAFPCPRWKTTPGNVGPRPDGNDNLQRLCDPSTGTVQHFSHFLRCKGVITKLYNCATLRNFYSNKERLPLANLLMGKCCNTGCNSDCTLYYVLYTIYSILY